MYEYAAEVKLGLAGIVGALTIFWGLSGWLWFFWIVCLTVDHVTGTIAACRAGRWSSARSRAGIWGKLSGMLVVLITAAVDFMAGLVIESIPLLPLTYTTWLSPVVLAWYILTEVGSILENLGALGTKLPPFLVRWIEVLQKKVGQAGEQVASQRDEIER